MRELLLIAIVLACPLMMLLMMRGGHGRHADGKAHHDGGCGHHGHGGGNESERSTTDLVRQRDELDRLIAARERDESTPPAPTAGARS